jgi:hypothetical protein
MQFLGQKATQFSLVIIKTTTLFKAQEVMESPVNRFTQDDGIASE